MSAAAAVEAAAACLTSWGTFAGSSGSKRPLGKWQEVHITMESVLKNTQQLLRKYTWKSVKMSEFSYYFSPCLA